MDSHSSSLLRSSKSSKRSPFQAWTRPVGDHHLGPRRLSPCLEGIALSQKLQSEGRAAIGIPVLMELFGYRIDKRSLSGKNDMSSDSDVILVSLLQSRFCSICL
jgi:hypothetical protein